MPLNASLCAVFGHWLQSLLLPFLSCRVALARGAWTRLSFEFSWAACARTLSLKYSPTGIQMPRLIYVERHTETVARRATSSSMGVGVLIGALVVALLGLASFYLWRRSQRARRARRRVRPIDPILSMPTGRLHEKDDIPISPFLGHHEEMMIQRPVLHITHLPPPSRGGNGAGDSPGSALDERGRWTGRQPQTPNSADPPLSAGVASPQSASLLSPMSAGLGSPSGSGPAVGSPLPSTPSSSGRAKTRWPPVALNLDNARSTTANAHVRQSVNGTVELTVNIPPPLPVARAAKASPATHNDPSRHPYAGPTTVPPPAAPPSNRGKRSSTEKNSQFFVHNRVFSPPITPAPRYSILSRLNSIGGLLHAPPTALPAYQSSRPELPSLRAQQAEAGPSGHVRQDSGSRFPPPVPPPSGPPPSPPVKR